MTDVTLLLQKIKACTHDDTLYLLEQDSNNGGFFALNGNLLYMVPNNEECDYHNIKTEYLHLVANVHISAFNASVSTFENGIYNYIELFISDTDECTENVNAFVNLCLSYAANAQEVDFISFFDSLVTLFQLPHEQNHKNLIGLLGELFVIEYVYQELGLDISRYWHSAGTTSKLDFVCPKCHLEVKTTASSSTNFMIKHEQLFTDPKYNYLLAVSVEENNTGRTLNEIINSMLDDPSYCNGLAFATNIEREKRRILPSDMSSERFLFKSIKAYHAQDINPFGTIPDSVESLSYKLDLLAYNDIPLEEVFCIDKISKITVNINQLNIGNGTQTNVVPQPNSTTNIGCDQRESKFTTYLPQGAAKQLQTDNESKQIN